MLILIKRLFFLLAPALPMASCQRVVDIKLQSSETLYVITGALTDKPGDCQVSITRTKSFSEDNNFPGVDGATVTIENNGVITTLDGAGDGIYRTSAINGTYGQTYSLSVHVEGHTFSASSTMPQPVPLDSLYISTDALSTDKYVTVVYRDPAGVRNYYKFIQYVNGKKEKSIFASNDEFSDGQYVRSQLNFNNDTDDSTRKILKGDTVTIDMLCTDAAVYKYWYSLNDGATGSNQSASPANPVTNIAGGTVMGYFSAQTTQRKMVVAP